MKGYFLLTALACCLAFSGCKATRHAAGDGKVIKGIHEASELLSIVRATDLPYTWFSATGNGTIDWEGQRLSAKVVVRIKRDSAIWVQISKLGFEVGRMLVRPDSSFFINRLERSYAAHRTAEFFEEYNLPADFSMFSKVFTSGAYVPPVITEMQIGDDGSLMIDGAGQVTAHHWIATDRTLLRSLVTDPKGHEWNADYSAYTAVNTGQRFPFHRGNTLTIEGETNLFTLDYSVIEVDIPQELPFSIPSHYEKM